MKKTLLLIACTLALAVSTAGCASVSQAVNAYGAVAVSGAQAANDTIIAANKVALCAIPISALVRHPELVPAVRALCMPRGDGGTVDQVLDTVAANKVAANNTAAPPAPVPK